MINYRERAMELYKQGYNCSQSVFAAFCEDVGMDLEKALKISSSFGGGMGGMREVCGSVSGMFMVAGMKYGYTDPADKLSKQKHYKLIQSLAQQFSEKNGSIICRELLGLNVKNGGDISGIKTEKSYKKRPCVEMVGDAADIICGLMKSEFEKDKLVDN